MMRLKIGRNKIYQHTKKEWDRINMLKRLEPCDLLSIQEVAGRLDISERTIYKYVKEKRIKAVRIGRKWRIPVASYLAFVYGNAAEDMKKAIAFLNDVDDEMNIMHRNS